MYLSFQIYRDEPWLGGGQALVQKWGPVSDGGIDKILPDGGTPSHPRKKPWIILAHILTVLMDNSHHFKSCLTMRIKVLFLDRSVYLLSDTTQGEVIIFCISRFAKKNGCAHVVSYNRFTQ